MDFTRFCRHKSTLGSKLLECQQAQLDKAPVPADSIVKTLNVIKHIRLGVLPGGVDMAFDSLFLQATEERFGNCIIPTVSPAAHDGLELVVFAPAIEVIAAKLGAFNRSSQHWVLGPPAPNSHHQGVEYQLRGQ